METNTKRAAVPNAALTNDLRQERRRRGLTCKQVAMLIGKSVEVVRMYERGDALPSLITALKLAILYRTQVAAVYFRLHRELTVRMRADEERLLRRFGGQS